MSRPGYDPVAHGVGIVHLGIGAFHRAHQAVYLDDVLAREGGDWRILGVSLRSGQVRDRLAGQDMLYSVVERAGAGQQVRIVGAVADVLVAPEDPARVVAALARPETHIVSLTITEKGYCLDPATGRLDVTDPGIAHDLANPSAPRTAAGFLVAALARRRSAGVAPPTLLSCDNLAGNGPTLHRALVAMAGRRDPSLADWIESEVACPATMVDRIVPAATPDQLDAIAALLGCRDEATVVTEPSSQWVIEDRFGGPCPDLAAVGVQLVSDVRPFEIAKLRMLNASHSLLAYLGLLAGHAFMHEVVAVPAFARLARQFLAAEVIPTLPPATGLDPASYGESLMARFANAALHHSLRQIAADGSQKLPPRLLGTVRENMAAGRPFECAALAVAAWIRYAIGCGEDGSRHRLDDPLADRIEAIVARSRTEDDLVANLLGYTPIFGELGRSEQFRSTVTRQLSGLLADGAHSTVEKVCDTGERD